MTAAVVQYIRICCIQCFCAFGAPGSARTRGLSLWVFQEGGRADAQRKRDATRRTSHQASHRRLCRFPALYHPPFRGTKHLYRNTLFILVSIQRRGDTAQSRRRCCSIPAESVLNLGGFGALTERYIHLKNSLLCSHIVAALFRMIAQHICNKPNITLNLFRRAHMCCNRTHVRL